LRLVHHQQAALAWAACVTSQASKAISSSALELLRAGTPKAAATRRSVSSASICVVTRLAACTLDGSSAASRARTMVVLPAPDLAGDDNEAFITLHTIFQVSLCTAVLAAAVIKL